MVFVSEVVTRCIGALLWCGHGEFKYNFFLKMEDNKQRQKPKEIIFRNIPFESKEIKVLMKNN